MDTPPNQSGFVTPLPSQVKQVNHSRLPSRCSAGLATSRLQNSGDTNVGLIYIMQI